MQTYFSQDDSTIQVSIADCQLNFQFVDWDTAALGKPVYHLTRWSVGSDVLACRSAVNANFLKEAISFDLMLSARVPSSDLAVRHLLGSMGFEFVELTLHPEISLENPPRKFEPRVAMRNADSTDLDLLLSESEEAFQYSRFFRDTQIPRHAAGARFREWVRAGLESEDKDLLIFSDEQGTPIAFFLVKPVGSDCFLELTSMLAASRGKSLATLVWETFLASAENRGFKKIRTNISGENSAVVALYPKLGFLLREPSVAFHFHSSELSK